MVLPVFKPVSMQRILPNNRYNDAERLLVVQINSELSKKPFDTVSARQFLEAYFRDLAMDTINSHIQGLAQPHQTDVSLELLKVVCKLLQTVLNTPSNESSTNLLLDAIITSGRIENPSLSSILVTAFDTRVAEEVISSMHSAMRSCFGPRIEPIQTLQSLVRATYVLSTILQTDIPAILDQFSSPNSTACIDTLIQIYDIILTSIRTSLPGSIDKAPWSQSWFQIKLSLLDTIDTALGFLCTHLGRLDRLCELAVHLSNTSRPREHASVLFDASLLQDYEFLFKFSHDLKGIADDDRLQVLIATFMASTEDVKVDPTIVHRFAPPSDKDKTPLARHTSLPPVDLKGKGKAVSQQDDPAIELAISHILDILPDQGPQFLHRCLQHPDFRGEGGTERLISSLLEGSLPIDLSVEESDTNANVPGLGDDLELVKDRRNVFDDQTIDMSTLRVGKKQSDADDLMQDRTWLQEMKAEIMRRAEADSGGEEEEPRYRTERRRMIPLDEDEFDEFEDSIGNVSVAGDGEGTGSEDEEEKESTSIETVLELAYIENPKLFDRDSGTRRSKARADLKAKTGMLKVSSTHTYLYYSPGWGDEQIEGWKIMLERNPRKNKILQKHEFRGNKPFSSPSHADSTEGRPLQSDRGRGRGQGRGRGGRGGGRGGGPAEGASGDAQNRAWKEKNKSRDRKRGHDKKMTRGGGPPA